MTANLFFDQLVASLSQCFDTYNTTVEKKLAKKRGACVSIILRLNPYFQNVNHETNDIIDASVLSPFDILYILRAEHEKDPWSGHVALPGGKVEPNETLYQCAVREVKEEIGIDLDNNDKYQFIGCLSTYPMGISRKKMSFVKPFLFVQRLHAHNEKMILNNDEVSDVSWINLSYFTTIDYLSYYNFININNIIMNDNDKINIGTVITEYESQNIDIERSSNRNKNNATKVVYNKNINNLRLFLNDNIKFSNIEFGVNLLILPTAHVNFPAIVLDCPHVCHIRLCLLLVLFFWLTFYTVELTVNLYAGIHIYN